MTSRRATRLLFTNKGLSVTPLQRWFADRLDDIAIVTEAALADEFRAVFAEVHAVADYFDDQAFYDTARCALAGRAAPVRSLCYLVEADVERCALLREEFGIAGLRHADSLCFRDKQLMKQRVAAAVPTPRFERVASTGELIAFAATVGLPVVLKPLRGFGSASVRVIADIDDLPALQTPMLAEEFVEGSMYHVDGFMRSGRVLAATVSRYVNGCLAFNRGRVLGSAQLDEGSPEQAALIEFARRVLRAMPHTELCLFHLEVFQRPGGELVFCEIGARIGGAHVYDVLNATFGADVVRLWLAAQMGLDLFDEIRPPSPKRHGWLLVPPTDGVLAQVRPEPLPPYLLRAVWPQDLPRRFARAAMSIDRVASFVVEGGDTAQVLARLRRCEQIAARALVWER